MSGRKREYPGNGRGGGIPENAGTAETVAGTVKLGEVVSIVRRHARLVLAIMALTAAAAAIMTYMAGPVYRAVAVIRLSDPRRALTGGVVQDPAAAEGRFSDPLVSQAELLTSRSVAGRVVDSMPVLRLGGKLPLRLLAGVAVAPAAPADTLQLTFGADSFTVRGASAERRAAYATAVELGEIRFTVVEQPDLGSAELYVLSSEAAVNRLIASLRVKRRIGTDIVDVAVSAPDPHLAQLVVNRTVDVFQTASAEAAQGQSRRRREFLEGQLRVSDSLLAEAREALTAFYQRAGYGARDGMIREQIGLAGVELERQELEAERRTQDDLLAGLRDPTASRRALRAALSQPGVAANPEVAQLSRQLFEYETSRDSLTSRSASHPDLPRVNQLIAATEEKLHRAVQAALQTSVATLGGRIAAMNDMRARQRSMSARESEEARLTERVDNARKVVDALRIEYQHARIAEAVTVGHVEIVDHAALPGSRAGLGVKQMLVLGLLVGLLLGAAAAFVAEHVGRSIARRGQVEQLGVGVLGVVPRCNGVRGPEEVVEAFRGIRLSLLNAYGQADPVTVAVTSPGPGDGKSFVSSNLALAFSYANHRTLLIDADLRRGALHRVLTRSREPGLTDVLVGSATLDDAVQRTAYGTLDFLGSGSRRSDAPELMGSGRMLELLATLRSRYGVIIVDTPPLGAGVDAFVLATMTGHALLVLRLGKTDRALTEAKLDVLRGLPPRVVGAVLNDVREGSEYHAYSYYMDGYDLSKEPLFRPVTSGRS
jgi:capsular exopolysaccharide synthesis family protein